MKILVCNFNNVLTDVIVALKEKGHEVLPEDGGQKTWEKADVIVVWNETELAGWREWIHRVKAAGKRVVLVQHGRRGTSRIYPPFNETLVSDAVCVWGENDKERLMSVGVQEDKIFVTGTPIWKHIKPREPHIGFNVLYSPEHWDVDVSENLIVADELRKLQGPKVHTKILKNHQIESLYDNVIVSERNSPEHFGILADALAKADVIVSLSESTLEMFAQSLDIPVVVADIWIPKACDGDDRYKEYKREYSNAVLKSSLKDLNKNIIHSLKHPELLRKERAEIIIGDGGYNISDPIGNIISVIENGHTGK